MAPPRAQQVIQEQVLIRPERYGDYHRDLITILNEAIRGIADGSGATKRRKDISDAIRAKASQMPAVRADS